MTAPVKKAPAVSLDQKAPFIAKPTNFIFFPNFNLIHNWNKSISG